MTQCPEVRCGYHWGNWMYQKIPSNSYAQGMEARIRLDGALLEEFSVENGLRQGSCMAPVLFNLYKCLVMECWQARVEDIGGVGVNLRYKYDSKLFRWYTRNVV